MSVRLTGLLVLGSVLGGCGPPDVVMDLQPDPARDGAEGLPGPFGVAHARFSVQARVSDVVDYEVAWPARRGGDVDRADGPFPVAVFVHGGLVEAPRYRWLITHLASRGYVVVSPDHDLDLAISESDNASRALDDARRRSARRGDLLAGALGDEAVIMGHSLGGVVSTFRWVADDAFLGVGVLASWAAEGTPVEDQRGRPSFSLIGSEDRSGEATRTAFEEYQRFPEPGWFGVVEGMNHYDWADVPSDANLLSDGVPTRPLADTRRDAARVIDAWMDAWLRDDAEAMARLDDHAFPGVRPEP